MQSLSIDEAKNIRKGEELNLEQLQQYLRTTWQMPDAEINVLQFPSGFSNLTYLLQFGDKDLVLRRPPFGAENIQKGHDMGREFKVLSMLQNCYSKSPKPLLYTEDKSIIGAPFYLMERVKGSIIRAGHELPFDETQMKRLNQHFLDTLAELHTIDIEKSGLIQLGKTEGYLQRQVEGWIQRYKNAQTDDIPAVNEIMEWFMSNMPTTQYNAMIHNDYKYDNVVLDPDDNTQIKAVLDWEMATVGDVWTDFGTTLAYTSEPSDPAEALKNFGIQLKKGTMSRQEMIEYYEQKTQRKVENIVFYYAFALFKLGVIVQQIYFRYKKGYTQDQRFAMLIYLVKDCAHVAHLAIKSNRISQF
ncbi:MAG: phosphotransferase family protein [Cytophagales bacterium]|nr:MAG: phosphotransferase family protein [Cytophagales bacterium]